MSRATVRKQIVQYLAPPNTLPVIEFCTEVLAQPPKVTLESQFDLGEWNGSAGLIFVSLTGQSERRIAFGGSPQDGGGRKERSYDCSLLVVMRSSKQQAQEVGDDFDEMLDSLTARIQSSRNAGSTTTTGAEAPLGTIFQWGEGDTISGGDDIIIETGLPHTIKGSLTEVIGSVRLTVIEILDT